MTKVGADITVFKFLKGINMKDGKGLFRVVGAGGGIGIKEKLG